MASDVEGPWRSISLTSCVLRLKPFSAFRSWNRLARFGSYTRGNFLCFLIHLLGRKRGWLLFLLYPRTLCHSCWLAIRSFLLAWTHVSIRTISMGEIDLRSFSCQPLFLLLWVNPHAIPAVSPWLTWKWLEKIAREVCAFHLQFAKQLLSG